MAHSDPSLDRFLDCSRERRLRLLIIPHCGDKDPCFACLTAERMLDAALRNEYDRGRRDGFREVAARQCHACASGVPSLAIRSHDGSIHCWAHTDAEGQAICFSTDVKLMCPEAFMGGIGQ